MIPNAVLILCTILAVVALITLYYRYSTVVVEDRHKVSRRVRKLPKYREAAIILGDLVDKVNTLIDHLERKYGKKSAIVRNLRRRFRPKSVFEQIPSFIEPNVAYTNNKGESIYICLRKIYFSQNMMQDTNTLMFVMLHEVSHIATNVRDHKKEFWRVFKFILQNAAEINIYTPINYRVAPQLYCNGMRINYNPLYDFGLAVPKVV
jgi:hypothetical protein